MAAVEAADVGVASLLAAQSNAARGHRGTGGGDALWEILRKFVPKLSGA